ncbi:hypothetical protein BLEM_0265 [Bifidobacterium lemurum]|uniref:DUF8094 domain-containing protein n=2 Tax=Bifidobacterium lemurum TaxID=1603886 RepID=A0A261FV07_9BIFI|nr:hypothetical protein BLEM_0265 [Bifidobacterium lemurum]
MNATRLSKVCAAATIVVAMTASLCACEGRVPTVSAPSSDSVSPDLTESQEQEIRTRILETLEAANEARSTDGLDQILSGPELQIRTSEILVAQTTGSLRKEATIPTDISQTVIPTNDGWPRSVFTITTTTEDQQSMRLLVLTQNSARENYKLTAVARLFSGAQLPKFAIAEIGSQMGDPEDENLVATPTEAVERYADVLQNGSNSEYASEFADDYFREQLAQLTTTVQEGMERNNGTQTQTFTADPQQMWIMRSTEGGDLVVATIASEWTRQAGEGRESQPASDEERALFGDGTATSTMKVTYVNVVALYVPSEDSGQQITAVGAERYPVKVEAL